MPILVHRHPSLAASRPSVPALTRRPRAGAWPSEPRQKYFARLRPVVTLAPAVFCVSERVGAVSRTFIPRAGCAMRSENLMNSIAEIPETLPLRPYSVDARSPVNPLRAAASGITPLRTDAWSTCASEMGPNSPRNVGKRRQSARFALESICCRSRRAAGVPQPGEGCWPGWLIGWDWMRWTARRKSVSPKNGLGQNSSGEVISGSR